MAKKSDSTVKLLKNISITFYWSNWYLASDVILKLIHLMFKKSVKIVVFHLSDNANTF